MKLRKTYIVEDESIKKSGTLIKNLDFTSPLVGLEIGFYGKRYDHTNTNAPYLLADIDKIEIVDGSEVIFSLSGRQAAAAQLYHTGKRPFEAFTLNSNSTNRSQITILFGRDKFDSSYMLDTKRFTNPQLKITYSFTEGTTGNWAEGTQTVTLAALIAEGAGAPRGYFMTKEVYSWSKSTSGDETIDLPRDLPYRFIMFQALAAETPIYAEFSKVKISCNYDEFVPINETTEDLAWSNLQDYGFQFQQTESIGDGSEENIKAYYPFAWNWGCFVQSWNLGQDCVPKRPYSGYTTLGRRTTGAASGNDFTSTFMADGQRGFSTGYGWEYYDTEVIPFGNIKDETNWFDPRGWKSVRLILTQAQTNALASSIVIQQVKSY